MLKTKDMRVRDPYIVVHNNEYYMYRWGENDIFLHKTTDFENWSDGEIVYTLSEDSWGSKDLWAPEIHEYKGRYYMFLSLYGKHGLRGTEISVSDTPEGPFVPLTNKPATPIERSCIDGTLYVENGIPYIVYSMNWTQNYDEKLDRYVGEIWALQLTDDLTDKVGKPFMLFRSNEAPTSTEMPVTINGKESAGFVSDGPFLQTLSDGTLYLTWSPHPKDNYIVSAAVSESGTIKGPWKHIDTPLYNNNGGHAMFFTNLEGKRIMAIHYPEIWHHEKAFFVEVVEENGILKIKE